MVMDGNTHYYALTCADFFQKLFKFAQYVNEILLFDVPQRPSGFSDLLTFPFSPVSLTFG